MIDGTRIKLRHKKLGDARNDYTWQTDPELAQLDAVPVLTISFAQYLLGYTWELHIPSLTTRRFAVEGLDGKHIGNCSYYNINETNRSEVSNLLCSLNLWNHK